MSERHQAIAAGRRRGTRTIRRVPVGRRPQLEGLEDRCLMAVTISEFPAAGPLGLPAGVVVDPFGVVWTTEASKGMIARMDPANPQNIAEYPVPTAGAAPTGITAGSGTTIYFTETLGNKIGTLDPADPTHIKEAAIPTADSAPWGIAEGPAGMIYFTETLGDKIGVFDPATGAVTQEIALPAGMSGPTGIAFDPGTQRLYFTASVSGSIGVLDPATSTITESTWSNPGATPLGIAVGSDNNLWFTEATSGALGQYNPTTGAVQEFSIGPVNSVPTGIVTGFQGLLYVTEALGNKIVSVDPNQPTSIVEYPVPTTLAIPFGVAWGGQFGYLAFTEAVGNKIGLLGGIGQEAPVNPGVSAAAALNPISEYALPGEGGGPFAIVNGPDQNLWFTEAVGGTIDRVDATTHAVSKFAPLTADSRPLGITNGPDGNLWFAEGVGKVGVMTTSGQAVAEYTLPTPDQSGPFGIAQGSDHNLWFTEILGNKIGRITPSGTITEFALPSANSGPAGIVAGRDGNLWFTELTGGRIGRITPSGTITEFALPSSDSGPAMITVGPNGDLWFTEVTGGKIGRITTNGTINEYDVSSFLGSPWGIATGPDGNLWFTQLIGNEVGSINPNSGAITSTTPVPTALSGPAGIVAGPDQRLWLTEYLAGPIGQVQIEPIATTTDLQSLSPQPGMIGESMPVVARVDAANQGVPPAGELVTFMEGTTILGTAPLDGTGHAEFKATFFVAGNHVVTARYGGDNLFAPSPLSNSVTLVVQGPLRQATVVNNLTATPNPSSFGQPVTLSVVVSPAGVAAGAIRAAQTEAPGGQVTFYLDGHVLKVVNVTAIDGSSRAVLVVPGLTVGSHWVTAYYNGDSRFAPSHAAAPIAVTVRPVPAGGPLVVNVQRFGYHAFPTTLVLTFDQPLDPGRAQNAANYRLTTAGGRHVPIVSAVYNAAARTVTLRPLVLLPLDITYRLQVNGTVPFGLTSATGQFLQGAGTGHPATNFVTIINRATLVRTPRGVPQGPVSLVRIQGR